MVVLGVVIPDRRMSAASRNVQVVVVGIQQQISFNVNTKAVPVGDLSAVNVCSSVFEDNFAQKAELVRYIGSDKQIKLSQREVSRVPLHGVAVEGYIAESANTQQRSAHVHSLHGVVRLNLLSLCRGRRSCLLLRGLCHGSVR